MGRTRVDDMANRHCGKLSKGYRQRVGLAQAIIHNPEVLILDEPTAGLDPKQIIETRQLIKELAGDHTIILSTHILPEVSQTCERVVIINKGRVVAVDTPANLTARLRGSETMYVQVDAAGRGRVRALRARSRRHSASPWPIRTTASSATKSSSENGPRRPPGARARGGHAELGAARAAADADEPRRDLPQPHHRERAPTAAERRRPMSNILAIAQKELKSYFASPIAYIVIGFFALIFGCFYIVIARVLHPQASMQMGMPGQAPGVNVNTMAIAAAAAERHRGRCCSCCR